MTLNPFCVSAAHTVVVLPHAVFISTVVFMLFTITVFHASYIKELIVCALAVYGNAYYKLTMLLLVMLYHSYRVFMYFCVYVVKGEQSVISWLLAVIRNIEIDRYKI